MKQLLRRIASLSRSVTARIRIKMSPLRYATSIGVSLGRDVHFYGMRPGMFGTEPWLIRFGSHVHVTSGCQFVTHDGGTLVLRHLDPTLEITAPIEVGSYVYFGVNTVVLPGVRIGDNVIIGAGSVVTRDIPAGTVAAGVPARVIKPIRQYHEQLRERSLGIGDLGSADKEQELRRIFADFINGKPERL